MNAAPTFGCERHHGWALHAWKNSDNLLHLISRNVHQHVLLIFGSLDRFDAEQQLVEHSLLLFIKILVRDEDSLALHHRFHLDKIVADKR